MTNEHDQQEVIEELALMYSAAVRCKVCPFMGTCKENAKYPQRSRKGNLVGCNEFIIELAKSRVMENRY